MADGTGTQSIRPGLVYVISAPSGAGKTTLVNALIQDLPGLVVSISHTTRPRRAGEKDGSAYHFIDDRTFSQMADRGAFLEHASVFDHQYGTSEEAVRTQLAAGNDVILEIDWQGARQVRSRLDDVTSIFILPPSLDDLERRLRARGDGDETISRRMRDARAEMSHYAEYEFLVVNGELQQALGDLTDIVRATRHRYRPLRGYFDARLRPLLREGDKFQ